MPTLPTDLRNQLERVVIAARDAAEVGAYAALEALAVHHHEPYPHMKPAQRELRNHLRARARQLGDRQDTHGRLAIDHLAGDCAYEHWHQMLFARFLAENNLLIEPDDNIAISLAEAEELAADVGMNVWAYASRCAQRMLPQIFRPDDPVLQVTYATEHMLKLEKLLAALPAAVFTASDALGWVYQFWQSKRKEEVNRSEVKIGADEISAVTQLFTEPYMVEFLLHNTLGAWWAGRVLSPEDAAAAKSEDELRAKLALPGVDWEYLRFVRGEDGEGAQWRPAAGTFDGWPKIAAELRILDPCCGSGHFLVAALHHLVPIRMAEEGLSAVEAVDAVLRDNLHGLEIDERCCQIAAFALAFTAWTYPDAAGYRPLPELNIACTGIGPQCSAEQWIKLAEQSEIPMPTDGHEAIKNGLLKLHRLFSQAPTLGSLINPTDLSADFITADYETIQPYLTAILKAEKADDETRVRAIAAAGMVKAADLLADKYTLVITNVPYLGNRKQNRTLKTYCAEAYPKAKANLATCLVERSLDLASCNGTASLVTPQNWLIQDSYRQIRHEFIRRYTWNMVALLGPGAFEELSGEVVDVVLLCITARPPASGSLIAGMSVAKETSPSQKAMGLQRVDIGITTQHSQQENPDSRVTLSSSGSASLLEKFAIAPQGIITGDMDRWVRKHWELPCLTGWWKPFLSTATGNFDYSGREHTIDWSNYGVGMIRPRPGNLAVGKRGVAVSQMGRVAATIYCGELYDGNIAPIIPIDTEHQLSIYACCSDQHFEISVRHIDRKVNLTNGSFLKVPFDLDHWQKIATKKYPNGLPEPESDDPTQWLFHGHPYRAETDTMLQIGVARLLGYRWPAELDDKMQMSARARNLVAKCGELAKFVDNDGIVCIPAVRGEEPAAERLLKLLTACGIAPEGDIDGWLRNSFFEEHSKLFHHRPFVWHIWDGRKRDGFHALVNYHKLCEGGGKGRRLMESLTYAYLGEWITRQRDEVKRGEGGAEDRLAAAVELQNQLKSIIDGEPPFDIFVRWKTLAEQPIGWEPDINDGVRVNIRPFLAADLPSGRTGAGILRWKPNIKWTKDRGKEPERSKAEYPWFWGWDEKTEDFAGGKKFDGNRHNDCHYTTMAKQSARDAAKE